MPKPSHILKTKVILRRAKIHVYRTIMRKGGRYIILSAADAYKLEVWEQKIFQRMFGGRKEGDVWERRKNQELQQLYGIETITKIIRAQRIRWLRHVERRTEDRIVKKSVVHEDSDNKKTRSI